MPMSSGAWRNFSIVVSFTGILSHVMKVRGTKFGPSERGEYTLNHGG